MPHDQALKTAQQMKEAQNAVEPDDVPDEHFGDLNAVFDEVNSLPADDPLRQPANAAAMAENRSADEAFEEAVKEKPKPVGLAALPDKVLDAIHPHGGARVDTSEMAANEVSVSAPVIRPQVQVRDNGAVVVDPGKRVTVPDFHGNDLRSVVERAGGLRLRVRTLAVGWRRTRRRWRAQWCRWERRSSFGLRGKGGSEKQRQEPGRNGRQGSKFRNGVGA